ncbi:MAG: hypothetical protein ACOY3P_18195 [Planctomycetota bacterium]
MIACAFPLSTVARAGVDARAGRRAVSIEGSRGWRSLPSTGRERRLPDAVGGFLGELNPLERRLLDDIADGRLQDHSLLTAALVAGGVEDDEELCYYQARAAELLAELRVETRLNGSPFERAQTIFEFLHRRVLFAGYDLAYTDLRLVLDEGRYNCVSASVLFGFLAGECGLRTSLLETTGHAMCRLGLPDGSIDVESTCADWFRLMSDPATQERRVRAMVGGAASQPLPLREVGTAEVAAMIYYNRGVDLLGEKRFAEAAAANAKALRLDVRNRTIRGNLLATINNWAIVESARNRFAEARDLLARGMAIDPTYETFGVNWVHVHHQWAARLCDEERFADALALLTAAARQTPQVSGLGQIRVEIYRRWARSAYEHEGMRAALSLLNEARHACANASDVRLAEAIELNEWSLAHVAEGRMEAALELYDVALARQPDSSLLRENRLAVLLRWAEEAICRNEYAEGIRRLHFRAPMEPAPAEVVENLRHAYVQWSAQLAGKGRLREAIEIERRAKADPILKRAATTAAFGSSR